jgi:lipid A 4'-phosphatase
MFPVQSPPLDDSQTPPLFFWVLGLSAAVALVPTLWMGLDLRAAALFAGPTPAITSVHWWWVELINWYVPAVFRGGIAVAMVVWLVATVRKQSKSLRLAMAFLVLAGILGPGMVVNWGFKDHWQRARPYQVENFGGTQQFTRAAVMTDQCNNNYSFVSGHVACGALFAALMLIHRRRKVAWAVAGSVSLLVIGFARMSDMAHWFSDVLWAYPITLVTCWLTWQALQWVYAGESNPSRTVG